MRFRAPVLFAACLAMLFGLASLEGQQQPAPKSPYAKPNPVKLAPGPSSAERGAQLVLLGGCNDCHTPKLPGGKWDKARALSGHPADAPLAPDVVGGVSTNLMLTSWKGPWGTTLARNITPDKETGIGTWTVADFKKTLRTGINPKGEVIRPPMPIDTLQNLPEEDLEAIYAYLMSVKPIRNAVGTQEPAKAARQ